MIPSTHSHSPTPDHSAGCDWLQYYCCAAVCVRGCIMSLQEQEHSSNIVHCSCNAYYRLAAECGWLPCIASICLCECVCSSVHGNNTKRHTRLVFSSSSIPLAYTL